MKYGFKFFMLVGAVVALSCSSFSIQSYAADGKALYQSKCTMCHPNSNGKVASNLIGQSGKNIMKAINGVAMMAMLKGKITKGEADTIGKYLKSLKK